MKTLILLLAIPTLITTAQAKCNTMAIGVYHESGFGLSFGSGNSAGFYDKNNVNVPVTINGEQACFRQKTAFKMKSEKKGDRPMESSISLTPMKTDFENVPSPSQKQYIIVEKNENKKLTKFHVLNFVCSGEIPISIYATSDSVAEIENPSNRAEVDVSGIIATGAAAANLRNYLSTPNSSIETYKYFSKIYKDKSTKEVDCVTCTEHNTYRVPSILTSISVHALAGVERQIASTFTTMEADVPNGCSK